MKLPKLKEGDRILVIWVDSFTPTHSDWMDSDDLDEHLGTCVEICTLGTYVRNDKNFIHLCASVAKVDGEIMGYLNPMTIPVGCITKVKKLP